MKKITITGGVALFALIGAVKVAQGACMVAAHALTQWGSWSPAEAAQADADALNVDQAYRLTLLELGITE